MELTREQQLFQTVINKAWEDESFKKSLLTNPIEAIETLTGEKVSLPEGKTLVVRDQTSEETIYINIPAEQKMEDVELNEEQLEAVAGGKSLLTSWPGLPTVIFGDPRDWETPPIIPNPGVPGNSTI